MWCTGTQTSQQIINISLSYAPQQLQIVYGCRPDWLAEVYQTCEL